MDGIKASRAQCLSLLAQSSCGELMRLASESPSWPHYRFTREPQIGLVMLRGRIGGDGESFPCCEVLASQCRILDADGSPGIGYVLGEDHEHALWMARWDARLADPAFYERHGAPALQLLAERQKETRAAEALRLQDTRVEFFSRETMR